MITRLNVGLIMSCDHEGCSRETLCHSIFAPGGAVSKGWIVILDSTKVSFPLTEADLASAATYCRIHVSA